LMKKIHNNHNTLDPSLLDGKKMILAKTGLGLRRFTDKVLAKYNIKPEVVLETINAENALRLANSGIGITVVPQSVIENTKNMENTNMYPLTDPDFKRHIVISYKKGENVTPAAQTFIGMATEMCRKEA